MQPRITIQVNNAPRVVTANSPLTEREKARQTLRQSRPTTWSVVVEICEGTVSDGMWVRLTHAAKFTDYAAAEQMAARIEAKIASERRLNEREPLEALNLDHWIWSHGMTNAFTVLQKAPTAQEYVVGY